LLDVGLLRSLGWRYRDELRSGTEKAYKDFMSIIAK
jgi:hypothetical protein